MILINDYGMAQEKFRKIVTLPDEIKSIPREGGILGLLCMWQ